MATETELNLLARVAALEKYIDELKGLDRPGSTLFSAGRIPFADSDGTLTTESTLAYNPVTNTITIETWQTLPLLNGWTPHFAGWQTPEFTRDTLGFVHLRGLLRIGTATPGTIFAQLPAGYRPLANELFVTSSYNTTQGDYGVRIDIHTDGTITCPTNTISTGAHFTISGITFAI